MAMQDVGRQVELTARRMNWESVEQPGDRLGNSGVTGKTIDTRRSLCRKNMGCEGY